MIVRLNFLQAHYDKTVEHIIKMGASRVRFKSKDKIMLQF